MLTDISTQFDAEIALVQAAIAHPAGFDLDFGGGLIFIRTTDQLTIEVEWLDAHNMPTNRNATCYKSFLIGEIKEAATFFVQKRHELRLGFDFEQLDYEDIR